MRHKDQIMICIYYFVITGPATYVYSAVSVALLETITTYYLEWISKIQ